MTNSGIISAAALIAALAIFLVKGVYSISGNGTGGVYRVNNFTGSISYCAAGMAKCVSIGG